MNVTIVAALVAGMLSFLSPCVLPLVPPYLVYLTGTSLERFAAAEMKPRVRRETILAAFLFVLSGSFAARENYVVTFSTRAGAPPSGVSLIAAYAELGILDDLDDVFEEGITWCASVLESHLSYPLLAYFRSSHDRESWIATVEGSVRTRNKLLILLHGILRRARKVYGLPLNAAAEAFVESFLEPQQYARMMDEWQAATSAALARQL